jgi:hypothetical protein
MQFRDYFTEIVLRNTELLATGYKLYQLKDFYRAKANKLLPIENKFNKWLRDLQRF